MEITSQSVNPWELSDARLAPPSLTVGIEPLSIGRPIQQAANALRYLGLTIPHDRIDEPRLGQRLNLDGRNVATNRQLALSPPGTAHPDASGAKGSEPAPRRLPHPKTRPGCGTCQRL